MKKTHYTKAHARLISELQKQLQLKDVLAIRRTSKRLSRLHTRQLQRKEKYSA